MSIWAVLIIFALGFLFGFLARDSAIPVPEVNGPDGTYPRKEDGYTS